MFKLKRIMLPVFLLATLLIIQSCIRNSNLDSYPTVKFSTEVLPIIASNCTQSGCHGYVNTEQFSLMNYSEILGHVSAGDGRKSSIYRAITGRSIGNFMPPSPSAPLTEDQIRTIFVWIEQGALNN